jgi:hypothetical protein
LKGKTMKTNLKMKTLAAMMAVAATLAGTAQASDGTDTTSPYSVANRVNFSIVIPAFLYFRVGPVGAANDPTLTFTVPAANVGNSTPVAGTGGDAGASAVNVEVRGNNGQVTIATTVSSASGLGTGTAADGFISFGAITTTASNASLAAPTLANSGITNTTPALGCDVACAGLGKVTRRTGTWTYAYANTTIPSAGTYTGFATYTASMP